MLIPSGIIVFFREKLILWDIELNKRSMPWKGEKDPYKIWLSEIILQQTRVEQGLPYYERFTKKYPNVEMLANADDSDVFKQWEGLGYYSRCRNLLETARNVRDNFKGKFPQDYREIRNLKGIGDYTAAAIASFAFDKAHAVVDGNVTRVLSRFFGIYTEIDSSQGKILFAELAEQLLDTDKPGKHNQAIMDFGALVCKPKLPACDICPLATECIAYQKNLVSQLPVKRRPAKKLERRFYYFIMEFQGMVYVRKRTEKDIWQNLYEFVLWETPAGGGREGLTENDFLKKFSLQRTGKVLNISTEQKQVLSHQVLRARFVTIRLDKPFFNGKDYELVNSKRLSTLPFPKLITTYLADKNVSLFLL